MSTTLEIVLLPGLDGTGRLLEPFIGALPPNLRASAIAYPPDVSMTYSDLSTLVRNALPHDRSFVIVAESFSGPIAIELAASKPIGLVALVLVGTFLRNPLRFLPAWTSLLVPDGLFRFTPPAWTLRWLVAGADAPAELLFEARSAWRIVRPAVRASRVREVLSVDVADRFRQIEVPIL